MQLRPDIADATVDGQTVYYRPGEVIAIGQAARDFVLPPDETIPDENVLDRHTPTDRPSISARPPAFRIVGVAEPLAVVDRARAHGLQVQPNHVLFSGSGRAADPCCGEHPWGALPDPENWSADYTAKPYRANPYRANNRTSAVPTAGSFADDPVTDGARHDVTIWILDTGIAAAGFQTALDGRGITGEDEDQPDQIPNGGEGLIDSVAGHGTFIAGIFEQLVPGCSIDVRAIIKPCGDLAEWDVAEEIHGLLHTAGGDFSRTILNLSFGGSLYTPCSPLVGQAIAAAQEAGVVVVASAGNERSCLPVYPANFPGVVAVGAVDSDGRAADFTNYGSWVQACALGVDVVSTFFNFTSPTGTAVPEGELQLKDFASGWVIWSGTSFAAPVFAAAIAQQLLPNAQLTAYAALDTLLDAGTTTQCLGKLVNPDGVTDLLVLA